MISNDGKLNPIEQVDLLQKSDDASSLAVGTFVKSSRIVLTVKCLAL